MTHIFASSSLVVTGNPANHPSQDELNMIDTKSIAELMNEIKDSEEPGKNDSQQSNRETLS